MSSKTFFGAMRGLEIDDTYVWKNNCEVTMGVVRRLQQNKYEKQEVYLGCVCEISKQQNGGYVDI